MRDSIFSVWSKHSRLGRILGVHSFLQTMKCEIQGSPKLWGGGIFFCIAFLVPYLMNPDPDWDVANYVMIGKGIFEKGILPYGYVFEHKPYILYVIYYLWSSIYPFVIGKFTVLAIISAVISSLMLSRLFSVKSFYFFSFLIIGCASGNFLSGNSEVVQLPFLVAFYLAISRVIETGKYRDAILLGVISAFSVNINYLSAFIIIFSFAWLLLCRVVLLRIFSFIVLGGALGLIAIFMPFFIKGGHCLEDYFSMQIHFLKNYGALASERYDMFRSIGLKLAVCSPIIIAFFRNMRSSSFYKEDLVKIWFVASVVTSFLSGHPYDHYNLLYLFPIMVMSALSYERNKIDGLYFVPLIIFSFVFSVDYFYRNWVDYKYYVKENIPKVKSIIGKEKVFNIRADQSLFYLAGLEPFDKFLFIDHIDFYFKQGAQNYILKRLTERPPFVVMRYRGCETGIVEPAVCTVLHSNYNLVYVVHKRSEPYKVSFRRYFELYRLK